jgi:maltose O-acetyltransferase
VNRAATVARVRDALRAEYVGMDVRASLARVVVAPLPRGAACRTRAQLMRLVGVSIGPRTLVMSSLRISGGAGAARRVRIGADCFINEDCVIDATADVQIGNDVNFGQGVLVTTSGHAVGSPERRAGLIQPEPVRIGDGAWLASRVIVLPGIEIGEGAIVGAGAVVTRSVAPHTLAAGVPAREIRRLDSPANHRR